jgi:hypothetical protein
MLTLPLSLSLSLSHTDMGIDKNRLDEMAVHNHTNTYTSLNRALIEPS